jgi:NADH-dependent peroxiredoxin subunit F
MLEAHILEQLKSVYQVLEREVTLVVARSTHQQQALLVELAQQLATTSAKILVRESDEISQLPQLTLEYAGNPTGITFLGIPGGHEFTSLVLAILNSDGKGKLPDQALINRIQRLKGSIELRTYISLECESCPEVVQNLNLMALFKPDFQHTMIDGALVQEEVKALGIQGVPSVMHQHKLISTGKTGLIELIGKLEQAFGSEALPADPQQLDLGQYDVVVLGAGPGGASAAIYSARKGLKTAIIAERMGGQVQDTKGIENLISIKYTEGPQLAAQLFQHISTYDIKVLEHRRVKNIDSTHNNKRLELESGEFLHSKAIIVATGAKWRELGIPGEKEYLGRGVAFCPHCDGPYFKGKDIAVVGGGNSGVEAAIDLAGIVKSVTLFEFMPQLKADQVLVEKLKSLPNVTIIANARLIRVIGDQGKVVALEYEDRTSGELKTRELAGIFVQIGLLPNSHFIKDVVNTNRFGEILIDDKCRTNVPGIYAAGDVTNVPYKQIIVAMGEGAKAGLTAFEDLMLK